MVRLRTHLTFTDEVLGTANANPDIYREFIESQRPEEAEPVDEAEMLPSVDKMIHDGSTVFLRKDGQPILCAYQIKGFFKDACSMLARADETESKELRAYKKVIDGGVFVEPDYIPLVLPEGGEMGWCVRPLRAQTPKGERVALSRSETMPAGTTCEFVITVLAEKTVDLLYEWLEYGKWRGLCQWRNSGKGRFEATVEVEK